MQVQFNEKRKGMARRTVCTRGGGLVSNNLEHLELLHTLQARDSSIHIALNTPYSTTVLVQNCGDT